MRNTSKIRRVKEEQKRSERKVISAKVKNTRLNKQAKPELKSSRTEELKNRQIESNASRAEKLAIEATKVKRLAMYVKPKFVIMSKKEIAVLSESDRAIYFAQRSKEQRKND